MATLILPYSKGAAVTPHDTNENVCVAFFVGGAGNVVVETKGGSTLTLNGCLAGTIYPIECRLIKATNTTATNIVALF